MLKEYVCQNCGKQRLLLFFEMKDVPIHSCVLTSTRQEALSFPCDDINLVFCNNCGFISNVAFNPSLLDYSINYEDQQCFSPTFSSYARDLANNLIEKYNLYDKDILEIGCGKGDFLAMLCNLGKNRGVGIDPAVSDDRIHIESSEQLTLIKDYYSKRYAEYHGDLICCRHTLEHIYNTNEFVSSVRCSIEDRLDTVVFFEVPDVTRILSEIAFWDVYYEHCSYFSPGSLARLFRFSKFEIIDLYRDFNDQYLLLEAKPTTESSTKVHLLEENVEEMMKDVYYFSMHYNEKLDYWKNYIQQLKSDEKRAVIWGAGSKCVSFLTTIGVNNEIEFVIDINPYRHGKFLPIVGKEIMPPEFLQKYDPDITIVMNPIYKNEIQQMLDDIGVSTEVVPLE